MVPRAEETRVLFRLFRTSFHYAKPKGEPTREDRYNFSRTRTASLEFWVWICLRVRRCSLTEMKVLPVATADAGSSSAAPPLDLASRLTENAEIVSECLSVLQQLVPQLSAEERVLVATQHPYATPVWLDSLAALSRGQLSDDLLLIVDLERELANCQVLASTRTRQPTHPPDAPSACLP